MSAYEPEFKPGDRVIVDISKCSGWGKYGPGAVIHQEGLVPGPGHGASIADAAKNADDRPVAYAIQMDGYAYGDGPGNYHIVDPNRLTAEAVVTADEEAQAIASILGVGTVTLSLPPRKKQMPKPKLEINEVWILEEVMPYDGSSIIGVFVDVDAAKADREGWRKLPDGDWTTAPLKESYKEFFVITKHAIRRK